MFNKKPSVKYLRLFGSTTFVRVPEEKRASKWDRKADKGILLRYAEVGYRVLVNGKVTAARHAVIIEEDVHCISCKDERDTDDDLESGNEKKSEEKYENPVENGKSLHDLMK